MAKKTQGKQQALYLIAVVAIVLAAMCAGLYVGGVRLDNFGLNSPSGDAATVRYATMTDAQMLCEARTREVFAERLRTLMVDSHSTRLDKKAKLFKVFLEADVYNRGQSGATSRHFINCFTRTDRLAIASYQFAKDGEPMRENGRSPFGL
jgi:hypothetical protein